jgi:asparagine synthase (glutamine-hydrolysing)
VTPADLVTSIPAVARHHDQPFGNSSALPAYYCARNAQSRRLQQDAGRRRRRRTVRRQLALRDAALFEFYHSVPKGCGDDRADVRRRQPLRRIPGLKQATGYVRHSRVPMPDRMQSFNLLMQLDPAKVLTADFLAQIDSTNRQAHAGHLERMPAPSLINRMLAYDWRYTLADSDLPKVRGATEMAGIAVGYPCWRPPDRFLDGLPPDWKLRRFKLRWFFKEALRGFLPDEIITKKKKGFGLPFGVWTTRTQH